MAGDGKIIGRRILYVIVAVEHHVAGTGQRISCLLICRNDGCLPIGTYLGDGVQRGHHVKQADWLALFYGEFKIDDILTVGDPGRNSTAITPAGADIPADGPAVIYGCIEREVYPVRYDGAQVIQPGGVAGGGRYLCILVDVLGF